MARQFRTNVRGITTGKPQAVQRIQPPISPVQEPQEVQELQPPISPVQEPAKTPDKGIKAFEEISNELGERLKTPTPSLSLPDREFIVAVFDYFLNAPGFVSNIEKFDEEIWSQVKKQIEGLSLKMDLSAFREKRLLKEIKVLRNLIKTQAPPTEPDKNQKWFKALAMGISGVILVFTATLLSPVAVAGAAAVSGAVSGAVGAGLISKAISDMAGCAPS